MEREQFDLIKIKAQSMGLAVKYELEEVQGDSVCTNEYLAQRAQMPHEDLRGAIDSLCPLVAYVAGYISDWKEECPPMSIESFSYSGQGEMVGVVINAVVKKSYFACKVKTPRLILSRVDDFTAELRAVLSRIEDEVYEYLFCGKEGEWEPLEDE